MRQDQIHDIHSALLSAGQPTRRVFLQRAGGAILLAFGAGTLTGCGGQNTAQQGGGGGGGGNGAPKKGGTIDAAVNTDAPTIDWTSSTATITRAVAWHIFEPLFAFDKTYVARPMVADGFEMSDDKKKYTIKLRKGLKFHDGTPVTADDVVASIKRWGAISGGGQETLKHIDQITASGDTTVEITLKNVFTPLIANLADPKQSLIVIPAKIAEAAGKKPLEDDQLVGTGPYKFEKWTRGQQISLKRYDGYSSRSEDWGGLAGKKTAYLDTIRMNVVKDQQVRLNQLQADEAQYSIELSLDAYKSLQSMDNVEPVVIPSSAWLSLIFNKARPPFNDVRMRQAANYALNKKEIGKAAYGDDRFWKADGSIFFPEQKDLYTTDGTENYDVHDVAKAKQLLKEAGYNNEKLRFMVTNLYPDHYDGAQVMVKQLKAAGFNIDLQVMEWPTLLTKREDKSAYEMFVTSFSPSFDPTGVIWLSPVYAGWYQSTKMAALLDQWAGTTGEAQRKKLLGQINALVYEEVPLIKIVNSASLHGRSSKLLGYRPWMDVRLWNTGF